MNVIVLRRLARRKRRIARRLENQPGIERPEPMMVGSDIHYELTDRTRAIAAGGIRTVHLLAGKFGLARTATGSSIVWSGTCPTADPWRPTPGPNGSFC